MKNALLIILVLFSLSALGQQMKATKIETTIDEKFRIIQGYITESKSEVKKMIAREAINGEVTNKELTYKLIYDLQAVMKEYRPKFMDAIETDITVDSLQTITEKTNLLSEITRLKAEIALGEDSTLIQPKINELTNKRNDLNKIIKTWVRISSELN